MTTGTKSGGEARLGYRIAESYWYRFVDDHSVRTYITEWALV